MLSETGISTPLGSDVREAIKTSLKPTANSSAQQERSPVPRLGVAKKVCACPPEMTKEMRRSVGKRAADNGDAEGVKGRRLDEEDGEGATVEDVEVVAKIDEDAEALELNVGEDTVVDDIDGEGVMDANMLRLSVFVCVLLVERVCSAVAEGV